MHEPYCSASTFECIGLFLYVFLLISRNLLVKDLYTQAIVICSRPNLCSLFDIDIQMGRGSQTETRFLVSI